jgi:hypothetical protein
MAKAELMLELIAHGSPQEIILPISAHVHKYKERFIYTDRIDKTSTPIVYYESTPLNSWSNLQIIDRTHLIPANTYDLVAPKDTWAEFTSTAFTSAYKDVAITHKVTTDLNGKLRPLFFRHDLPKNTVEVNINVIQNGVVKDIESGYVADIESNVIYTNYKNKYNYDDGSYILYFVSSVDVEGNTTQTLLTPEQVAREATWEDVDLDSGEIKTEIPLYTREKSSSGYTFHMNLAQKYYVRVLEESTIKPKKPAGVDPTDPWNLRFTAGEFSTYTNGRFRRYWLPEYIQQAFQPYYPYIYSPYRKMTWVNRNILKATRDSIYIDPKKSMHMVIYVYDEDEVLRSLYTTDSSLQGTRYESTGSDESIFYDAESITSWDNKGGFVQMGIEVDPNWTYYASYFYESRELEYSSISLSPLQDKDALNYMWVYYMVPDADDNDRAIHVLKVDRGGYISSTTQIKGRSYPNLSLKNEDGTYNPDTIVGMKYRSAVEAETFIKKYSAQEDNTFAYYILAEVLVMDTAIKEESFIVDSSREGRTFTKDGFLSAIKANPRILQSKYGYGEDGQEIPTGGSYLLHYPVSLLEEYGGFLNKPEAEDLLKSNLPVYTFPVMVQEYPKVESEFKSLLANRIDIKVSWEGPKYSYEIYKKLNPGAEWEYFKTIDKKAYSDVGPWPESGSIWLEEIDESVESGLVYYYTIRIKEGNVEYPGTDLISIKVK